jgi:hypothetical protein
VGLYWYLGVQGQVRETLVLANNEYIIWDRIHHPHSLLIPSCSTNSKARQARQFASVIAWTATATLRKAMTRSRNCSLLGRSDFGIGEAGTTNHSRFSTFDKLAQSLESTLPSRSVEKSDLFLTSRRVDFGRFKRDFYDKSCGLDALIVKTGIRSYLKGSIEAVQKGGPLTEAEFLNTTKFGRKRCLLDPEQRSAVYQHFERYERNRKELELWDDCARDCHSAQDNQPSKHGRVLLSRGML